MNAKDEFLDITAQYKVIGATISFGNPTFSNTVIKADKFVLPLLYSDEEYNTFLENIDRKYSSGFGGQELFGIIFCEDSVWMERGEYDGSEWWNVHQYPDLGETFGDKNALKYNRYMKLKKIGE